MLTYEYSRNILPDGHLSVPPGILKKISKFKSFKIIIVPHEETETLRRKAKDKLLKLQGKVEWSGDLEESRKERKLW